jgi:hypothetical protein
MKILALRMAAFRRFSSPAAVEDIGDGVNVLAGPNEIGKSTVFHALEAAFVTRHKVTGAMLDLMRPRTGGEPMVEAEFEQGGERWRIRKQFGRGSAAVLTHLASGRVEARNAEAEERLAAMTGRSGDLPGRLGLVWVRQQRSLAAPDPDLGRLRGEKSALIEAIGREVEAAAGGETFERVQQRVSAALDLLLTPTRTALRKNGPLDLARRTRDAALMAIDEARRAESAAQDRLERLAAASSLLAERDSAAVRAAEGNAIMQLDARLDAAVKLRTARDLSRAALKGLQAEADLRRQSADAARHAAVRLTERRETLAVIDALQSGITSLAQSLNEDGATPARADRLKVLSHAQAMAEAELKGHAVTVDVALMPEGAGLVRIDGQPLAASAQLHVTGTTAIELGELAVVTITAAGADHASAVLRRLQDAQSEIASVLAAMGTASVDDAHTRASVRAGLVADLDQARARLSGLAPLGRDAMSSEIQKLEAAADAGRDLAALDADAASAAATIDRARLDHDKFEAVALSDAEFRNLSAEHTSAKTAADNRAREIQRLIVVVEKLKSEQDIADEDGRAAQVDARTGELALAEAEAQRLDVEARALALLSNTLAAIEEATRQSYFAPVTQRLEPHLNRVYGRAQAGFRDAFALGTLTRGGQAEDVATLSDGTREQLSVLVRLSFAELLAERGAPVPLVLDDPLVYSDDARLAAVCACLAGAITVPQIIVLTCRETAFQVLPGRRLAVSAWRPG